MAGLNARGLTLAPEADPATLIRRVTFDLTGLPPSPEAADAFVAEAATFPYAYEKLVDRLLASPEYGERRGRHWLDVVRFGESQGYETNLPRPGAWPYRDYVIRAFNRDTPFPQFVVDQLAGDADNNADWLTQAATGFLVGGTHDIVGNQTLDGMLQQRADDLDDMITATGTTFLGVTIQCARCHDHKFDPIGQRDYYGLQAIFAGVNHAERELAAPDTANRQREAAAITRELARIEERLDAVEPLARTDREGPVRPMVNPRRNVERFEPVRARMVRFTILATADGTEPCLDEVEVFTGGSGMEGAGFPPRPPGERVPEGRVRGEGIGVTSGAGDRPVSPGARPLTPPLSPLGRGRQVVSDATLLGEALAGLGPLPAGKRVPEGRVRGQGLGATKGAGARSPTAAGASPRLHHPVNVALTSAGGKASASSEYPDAAIHKIAHLNDGRVGNGRSWISRVPGKGTITIAWPEPATIDRVVWGRDREEVYRDRLATDYYLEVALEPGRWQVVASSLDRVAYRPSGASTPSNSAAGGLTPAAARERAELIARQTELRTRLSQLGATFKVYAGTFSQPAPTHLLVRGDPTRKGVEVRPSGVAVIHPELVLDPRSPEQSAGVPWRGGLPIPPIRCRRG